MPPDGVIQPLNEADLEMEPVAPLSEADLEFDMGPRRGSLRSAVTPIPEFQDAPETPEPATRTYDEMNPLERVPGQLRSGVYGLAASSTTPTMAAEARMLRELDDIDAGTWQRQPNAQVPGLVEAYRIGQGPQRQRIRQTLERRYGENVSYILRQQAAAAAEPRNPRAEEIIRAGNEGRWGDVWRIGRDDPFGLLQQFGVESLPATAAMALPGLGTSLAGGGRAASALASYASSFGLEVGSQQLEAVSDALRRAGVDTSSPEAVGAWVRANPDAMRETTQAALRGANGPAIFDAFNMGWARGVVPGRGFVRNAGRVGTNFLANPAGEAAGAATGQLLNDGTIRPGDLIAEAAGGITQGGPATAIGTIQEAHEARAAGARSQAAPPVPPASPIPGPAVSPPPAPPPLEAAAPAAPEPPPPVSSPVAGEPPAPVPGAPAGMSPPVPGAVPSGDAGQAVPPVPPAEGVAATGISPAAPPQAGPAVAPGSEVSSGAPEVAPPNSPPVPLPPPVVVNPTQGLRDLLNDPRPLAQIQQEERAARERGIQAMRDVLPPGWSVVDEQGTISVLDPNGEWHTQAQEPVANIEGLRADVAQADAAGVQNGTYPDQTTRTARTAPFGSPEQTSAAGTLGAQSRRRSAEEQAQRDERATVTRRIRKVAADFASLGHGEQARAWRRLAGTDGQGRDNDTLRYAVEQGERQVAEAREARQRAEEQETQQAEARRQEEQARAAAEKQTRQEQRRAAAEARRQEAEAKAQAEAAAKAEQEEEDRRNGAAEMLRDVAEANDARLTSEEYATALRLMEEENLSPHQAIKRIQDSKAPPAPEPTVKFTKAKLRPVRRPDGGIQWVATPIEEGPSETIPKSDQPPAAPGPKRLVSDDRMAELKAKLRAKMGQLNAGLDPEMVALGAELAVGYLERGLTKFRDWSAQVIADLGENVRPYLRGWYEGARYYPGFEGAAEMTPPAEIDAGATEEKKESGDNGRPLGEGSDRGDGGGEPGPAPGDEGAPAPVLGVEGGPGEGRGGSVPPNPVADEGSGEASGASDVPGSSSPGSASESSSDEPRARDADKAAGDPDGGLTSATAPDAEVGQNFVIGDGDVLAQGGAVTRIRNNIAALRLLKQLQVEGRYATREEQETLARYVGWGALSQVFAKSPRREMADFQQELRDLLTPEEYEAARASTLNAHYTSPEVIRAMWAAVQRMGFEGGRVLEPSAGVGHFFGLAPQGTKKPMAFAGVELDKVTGGILTLLYPKARIQVTGFEKANVPDGFFDVAIGNVPFGDFGVVDTRQRYAGVKGAIHDYFFARAIDAVRPGGVLAFVTSRFTMDKLDQKTRARIGQEGKFLGAIRLPRTAFAGNAGTEVVTDIIFLQRWAPGEDKASGFDWTKTASVQTSDGRQAAVNAYYAENPQMMLGTLSYSGSMYGGNELTLEPREGQDLAEAMAGAIARLPQDIMRRAENQTTTAAPAVTEFAAADERDGYVGLGDGGAPYVVANRQRVPVPTAQAGLVRSYVGLRDALRSLVKAETASASDADLAPLRAALNTEYDAFVKAHGAINQATKRKSPNGSAYWHSKIERALGTEPDFFRVAAIEDYDRETGKATKRAIFRERIIAQRQAVSEATSTVDAIGLSVNALGRFDLSYAAEAMGKTEAEAIEAFGAMIYRNPDGERWELQADYLSGNVRDKLARAQAAAELDPAYERNVEALKERIPRDLIASADPDANEIYANMGAVWIGEKEYQDFLTHLLGGRTLPSVWGKPRIVYTEAAARWTVTIPSGVNGFAEAEDWATQRLFMTRIFDAAMNNAPLKVVDELPDGRKVTNAAETEAAMQARDKMRAEFQRWIFAEEGRAERLARIYNDRFNNLAPRDWNAMADYLQLPGITTKIVRGGQVLPFQLRAHQRVAVARVIAQGNTLFNHVVGAGKTYAMIASGMEMKRLGLVRKPAFVVPNHMVGQFQREFYELYPGADLMVATKQDMTAKGRKAFVGRVAAANVDAIIMRHSSFSRLGMRPEAYAEHVQEELAALIAALDAVKAEEGKSGPTVKDIERRKKALENKLASLTKEESKDTGATFEETGIDFLFVDEAHQFKKLGLVTTMGSVRGLDTGASQRAVDLLLKIRHLDKLYPGRSAVFATGTPVSNTMAEIYTMQRYLQPEALKERRIEHFDAWAANFGETTTAVEVDVTGSGFKQTTRFAKLQNAPELAAIFSEVCDTQTAAMLNLPRPKLAGGGMETVVIPATEWQKAKIRELGERYATLPNDPSIDNALKIIVEGRKSALDPRLMDPEAGEGGKLSAAVENMMRIYGAGSAAGSKAKLQIVFSDLGTPSARRAAKPKAGDTVTMEQDGTIARIDAPAEEETAPEADVNQQRAEAEEAAMEALGGNTGFNVYAAMKDMLVARGVPASEIAFIHDANTDGQKEDLFERARSGQVRFLFGSTAKMGVGTNVQRLAKALHHIDAPLRPSDVEQRDGRIWRQGNENEEIEIYRYVTEGTFDAYNWQILEAKAGFIGQFYAGARGSRSVEDADIPLPDAATVKAIATGDPRIKEVADLTADVRKLDVAYDQAARKQLVAKQSLPAEKRRAAEKKASADFFDQIASALKAAEFRDAKGGKLDADQAEAALAPAVKEAVATILRVGNSSGFGEQKEREVRWPITVGSHPMHIMLGINRRKNSEGKEFVRGAFSLEIGDQQRVGVGAESAGFWTPLGDQSGGDPIEARNLVARVVAAGRNTEGTSKRLRADAEAAERNVEVMERQAETDPPMRAELEEKRRRLRSLQSEIMDEKKEAGQRRREAEAEEEDEDSPRRPRIRIGEEDEEPLASIPQGWGAAETATSDDITPEGATALRDILQTIAGREAALEMTQRLGAVNKGEMPDAVAWGPLVRMAYMVGQERAGWVIRHEALHVLRNLGKITDAEWQILTEASAREGWKERFGIEGRYSATAARKAQQEEEAIVEAFAQWATGNAPAPSSAVERIFQKIRQFLVRLRNALKGRGFQDAESLFRKIERGDLGRRAGGTDTRGPGSVEKASQDMSRSGYGEADAFFASNRKRGAATRPGILDNDAFWEWFRRSAVVDRFGFPLVVYHSTRRAGFNVFYEGSHFGTKEQAEDIYQENSRVRGRLRNPEGFGVRDAVYPVYLSIQNPKRVTDQGDEAAWALAIEQAIEEGYDGLVYENTVEGNRGDDSWVAFRPEQVKSAIGNSGAFDRYSDDILASIPGDVARRGREKTEDFLRALFGKEQKNPQIDIEERAAARDVAAWQRFLKTPERLFRRFPSLNRLIESGMKAEQRMQTWLKSLTDDYEEIRRTLRRAKGDWAKVSDALVDADMEGVDYDDPAAIAAHLDAHELSPAERTATIATHQLLMKIGRVVDQHRRAMLPQVRARKAQVWKRMAAILDGAKVDSAEYAKAYRRRAYLNSRIKAGEGDIAAQALERDAITEKLRDLRLADDEVMGRYEALREDYDALEARLSETSIRKRVKGYFPHKFYGSWRLYENTGKDDEGNDTRREITSNQGFYDTREQAIAAAKAYLKDHPDANLEIKPRMVTFPAFLSGTPVSDASYRRLMARMEDEAGISGDAFRQVMKGIVRKRSRRRVLSAAMKRTGADGYAGFEEDNRGENADKVLRTHINQIVRYVVMDRMKFQFVNETERLGLSPYRREALKREGRIGLHDALEGWWRDLNGSKQPFEEQIDRWLTKAGVPGSVTGAAAAGAAIGGLAAGPLGAGALATYLGWRMSHAQRKGGEFQTRTFTGGIVGDVAHLKLGMGINIGSAAVNLTQTLINTYPVLGPRWTAEGTKRAAAAMWQQATTDKADWDGDARILQRLDIATDHRFTEEQALIRQHISTMKRISMFWFETAERMNRATAALGAYYRAIDAGRTPAQAIEEARKTLTDTQFQQGLANKPEMLRLQALRIPTQFWNFMFQQVAFAFKLGGQAKQSGDYAPVIRFYAMLFLMAGMLGLPAMGLLDWLLEKVTGERPTLLLRRWAIEEAQRSQASGTAAQVMLRGLPALAGIDISSRIGMGKGFGPNDLRDLTGPAIGSLIRWGELSRRDAPLLEQMGALSPIAEQSRNLAALARGDVERRSGIRRGAVEDRPTVTERVQSAAGFRPVGRSMEADVREFQAQVVERRRKGLDRYLSAIIQADERGEQDRIGDIAREARAAGVNLTQQQIVRAIRESRMTRAERDTRRAPREVRPEIYRLHQGVRDYRGAQR